MSRSRQEVSRIAHLSATVSSRLPVITELDTDVSSSDPLCRIIYN